MFHDPFNGSTIRIRPRNVRYDPGATLLAGSACEHVKRCPNVKSCSRQLKMLDLRSLVGLTLCLFSSYRSKLEILDDR